MLLCTGVWSSGLHRKEVGEGFDTGSWGTKLGTGSV